MTMMTSTTGLYPIAHTRENSGMLSLHSHKDSATRSKTSTAHCLQNVIVEAGTAPSYRQRTSPKPTVHCLMNKVVAKASVRPLPGPQRLGNFKTTTGMTTTTPLQRLPVGKPLSAAPMLLRPQQQLSYPKKSSRSYKIPVLKPLTVKFSKPRRHNELNAEQKLFVEVASSLRKAPTLIEDSEDASSVESPLQPPPFSLGFAA